MGKAISRILRSSDPELATQTAPSRLASTPMAASLPRPSETEKVVMRGSRKLSMPLAGGSPHDAFPVFVESGRRCHWTSRPLRRYWSTTSPWMRTIPLSEVATQRAPWRSTIMA